MKKPLILLSAIGLAGAACAQSSVTLFGIVDATLARGSGSIANRTQLTSGGHTTSRIGFRGVEDLGGGLSAIFWLEAGLAADSERVRPPTPTTSLLAPLPQPLVARV